MTIIPCFPMLITLRTYKDSTRLDIRYLEEDISFYSILEKVEQDQHRTHIKPASLVHTKFFLLYSISQFPVLESGCPAFVTYLTKEGLRHTTIKVYLSGV